MAVKIRERIGICKIGQDGNIAELQREFFGQGWVFKDWEAFQNQNYPDAPCYVPELSDTVYTAEDFLRICNGQKELADQLFDGVDWQHPESLMEEWMQNNEWVECPNCGRLVHYGDGSNDKNCPVCGVTMGRPLMWRDIAEGAYWGNEVNYGRKGSGLSESLFDISRGSKLHWYWH